MEFNGTVTMKSGVEFVGYVVFVVDDNGVVIYRDDGYITICDADDVEYATIHPAE